MKDKCCFFWKSANVQLLQAAGTCLLAPFQDVLKMSVVLPPVSTFLKRTTSDIKQLTGSSALLKTSKHAISSLSPLLTSLGSKPSGLNGNTEQGCSGLNGNTEQGCSGLNGNTEQGCLGLNGNTEQGCSGFNGPTEQGCSGLNGNTEQGCLGIKWKF